MAEIYVARSPSTSKQGGKEKQNTLSGHDRKASLPCQLHTYVGRRKLNLKTASIILSFGHVFWLLLYEARSNLLRTGILRLCKKNSWKGTCEHTRKSSSSFLFTSLPACRSLTSQNCFDFHGWCMVTWSRRKLFPSKVDFLSWCFHSSRKEN